MDRSGWYFKTQALPLGKISASLCFLLFFLQDLPDAKMETSLAAHFPQTVLMLIWKATGVKGDTFTPTQVKCML